MKIVAVVGGFGFVGKSVMEELRLRGYNPIALSRRSGFDLLNYEKAKGKLSGLRPEVIISCAAHVGSLHYVTQYAADVVYDNMQMILNTYKMASEVCPTARMINPIANCSYPGTANIYIESEWWGGPVHDSVFSYGNTRRMIYVVSKSYEMQYNISTANFLVPNCYGPGDSTDPNKTHALNGMIIRMLEAKDEKQSQFEIWGTGNPAREWIYVKDLARMLANAVEMDGPQLQPVNIAQNRAYSIKETAEMIKELTNYEGKLVFNTEYQDGALVKIMDDRLFREKFPGFEFTGIREGIEATIKYYKSKLEV